MEIIHRLMDLLERFRYIENRTQSVLILLTVITAFGIVNCLLGYRLLRFWMMLGGIAAGGVIGYLIVDSLENTSQNYYIFGSAGCGILLGILTFFIYKAGIFAIGAVPGFLISFYLLHPMAYSTLFVCLLIGTGIGMLTLKYQKTVVILITSLVGGILSGFAGVRLAELDDFPYGILISLAAAFLGILIQFQMNKTNKSEKKEKI